MSANSSIEWTEKTWNPVRGCSIVSPGCVNCYAMKQAHRFSGKRRRAIGSRPFSVELVDGPYHGLTKLTKAGPQWTGAVRTVHDALLEPLSWRKPQRVFVNSMSDLFHEDVPDAFIDQVFAVMALAPRHTFQVLTKRPDRMLAYLTAFDVYERISYTAGVIEMPEPILRRVETSGIGSWPLRNVWLGVSVENQKYADERIPLLLQTPAAIRFISAEPLLGQVDLSKVPDAAQTTRDALSGRNSWNGRLFERLDWAIVGGESGHGARPFSMEWARSIVAQCKAAGVACFVKQLGADPFEPYSDGERFADVTLKDRKGSDIEEFPPDLRVREFPLSRSPRAAEQGRG